MSLKNLTGMFKTIGFRITIWYIGIFSLSFLVLFSILYFYISSSLIQEDHQAIRAKLRELAGEYTKGGLKAVETEVNLEQQSGRRQSYYVRLMDDSGGIIYKSSPEPGVGDRVTEIDREPHWWQYLIDSVRGRQYVESASATMPDGRIIVVGRSPAGRERLLERFRETFGWGVMVAMVLGLCGGMFISIRALMPLRNIINTVKTIEDGRLDARVSIRQTGDELEELSMLFNRMLQRIEALVNGMRSALDNVAHDLRTPITRLRNTAEMAIPADDIETCHEALADCLEESEQIQTMLNTLMDISEAETGVMRLRIEEIDIVSLIEDVVDLYTYLAEDRGIMIHRELNDGIVLYADPGRLRQVVANLMDNAIKYTPKGGMVSVKADRQDKGVILSVEDTGIGIPDEELPRIWDRLYRGRNASSKKGLGLGLSLVRAVVHAHGGHVDVENRIEGGTIFRVYLPA